MTEHIGSLNIYGDSVDANTDNLSLWEHKNEPELDHVYLRLPERYNEGEQARAFYLWRAIGASAAAFTLFRDALLEEPDAELHRNINDASSNDREEFRRAAEKEMGHIIWDSDTLW